MAEHQVQASEAEAQAQAAAAKDAAADLRELAGTERSTAGFIQELKDLAETYGKEFLADLIADIEKNGHAPVIVSSMLHAKANELDPPAAAAEEKPAAADEAAADTEGMGSHSRRRR